MTVLVVPKNDPTKYRFVVDLRTMNNATLENQ